MADCSRIVLPLPQDEQVYVSDPKALYHIVLKDQDVFEETEYFTKYVGASLRAVYIFDSFMC